MTEIEQIVARLELEPLPEEGGYFRRVWTSPHSLPDGRPAATLIHFLLAPGSFSALHRLDADELWIFQAGDPVEQLQLTPGGQGQIFCLGPDVLDEQLPQVTVPRGTWQGARTLPPPPAFPPKETRGWSLVACLMMPGWTTTGFQLGKRYPLEHAFPAFRSLIEALTSPT